VIGPFTLRHLAVLALVLLVVGGLLALLSVPIDDAGSTSVAEPGSGFYLVDEPTEGLAIGAVAPELEGELDGARVPLLDLDGEVVSLAALRGSPVWLSFFATWCPPCQEETPVLRDAYQAYADDGLQMIAVSVQETTSDDVKAFADKYSLPYTIGFDATSAVFKAYHGFGLPTHVFIDADGVIRRLQYGPLDRAAAAAIIEPLLDG
jgi:peroxiredoxin